MLILIGWISQENIFSDQKTPHPKKGREEYYTFSRGTTHISDHVTRSTSLTRKTAGATKFTPATQRGVHDGPG